MIVNSDFQRNSAKLLPWKDRNQVIRNQQTRKTL